MLYLSGITIILVFLYLFKKQREIVKYIPISHKGLINLYQVINTNNSHISLYKMYFNIAIMFGLIIVMAFTLKLNFIFTGSLLIISLLLTPLIILWRLKYTREEFDFNNLVTYLNQFIMVFKSYPKVYSTLIEIENSISGDLQILVNNSIEQIKTGQSSLDALQEITNVFPHFIVHNLHTLVYSIEQYGTLEYFEALDLIQDDLDDWVEDMSAFNYSKNRIIQKVLILIIFAFLICFMALKMLFTVDTSINTTSYQVTMFAFCLIQILTYVVSSSLLNSKWIERSEII